MNAKILFLGEGGVGKTSLIRKYLGYDLPNSITLGVDFFTIRINNLTLVVWDLSGQERFRPLLDSFFYGAKLAVMVFDLSRPKTLFRLLEWTAYLKTKISDLSVIVVGNKKDLGKNIDDTVITSVIKQIPFHVIGYLETSAVTGENVNTLFSLISDTLIAHNGKMLNVIA
ncbi:MAG: hypothetical protein DRZ80_08175 [Thermoprotei archaeon]|nr:MAG: hypothetical protein DRZ80_08175 [Thermoprotei archaeon]